MKLVFIENNRLVTDSLTVSEIFGKEHKNVMRDITNQVEKLLEAEESNFVTLNFERISYRDSLNREQTKYILTEDAFAMISMAYVTVEAMKFKVKFLSEFNRMRNELNKSPFSLPQNFVQALEALVTSEKEKYLLEEQNAYKEQQLKLQEPKVALYDVAMSADGVQPVGTVAKELGLGRTRLFALLRDKKILRQNNEPYQEFIERGYFKLRMYTITHNTSGLENKTQPMVTPKGIAWLHKMLKEA